MKKKIVVVLSLVLCLTLGISLAACKKNKHKAKSEWKFDNAQHWHECATKGHDDKLDVAAHTWNDGEVITDPTETTEGVKTYTCTVCSATKTESMPKLNHTHTFDTSAWEKDGSKHWHKATCAHTDLKQDEADHTWNDGEITIDPTETAEGVKTYACTVCGQTKTEPVEKLAHTHTFDTSAWEKDGSKHWHKSTCGHDVKADEADHTFGAWTVKTPADYGVNKVEERTCTVCGKSQEQTIENSALAAKDNTVTVGTIDFTYNGESQSIDSLIEADNKAGMVVKYVGVDGTTYEESTAAPTNAGTYQYTITISATAEWKAAEKSGKFTIAKYELTEVYGKTHTKEYDGTKYIVISGVTTPFGDNLDVQLYLNSSNAGKSVPSSAVIDGSNKSNYRIDESKITAEVVTKKLSGLKITVNKDELDLSKETNTIYRTVKTGVKEQEVNVAIEFNPKWLDENGELEIYLNIVDSGSCKIRFNGVAYRNYEFVTGHIGTLTLVRAAA